MDMGMRQSCMYIRIPSCTSYQYVRPIALWILGIGASASLLSRSSLLYDHEVALTAANSVTNYLQIDPNATYIRVTSAKKDSLGFWARSTLQLITTNNTIDIKTTLKCDTFSENQFNLINYVKEPFLIKRHLKQLFGLYNKHSKQIGPIIDCDKRWKLVELVTDTDFKMRNNDINLDKLKDLQLSQMEDVADKNIQSTSRIYSLLFAMTASIIASAISLLKLTISYRSTKECIKFVNKVAINFHKKQTCTVKRNEGVVKSNYFDGKVYLSDNTCLKIVACRPNEFSHFTTHVCKYEDSNLRRIC